MSRTLNTGDYVEIYNSNEWFDGQIKSMNHENGMCLIHFFGWNSNYDENVHISTLKAMPPDRIAALIEKKAKAGGVVPTAAVQAVAAAVGSGGASIAVVGGAVASAGSGGSGGGAAGGGVSSGSKKRGVLWTRYANEETDEKSILTKYRELSMSDEAHGVMSMIQKHGIAWLNERDSDPDGWTCAHYAAFTGSIAVLKVMHRMGGYIDVRSTREHFEYTMGVTPLHVCVNSKKLSEATKIECLKVLLSCYDARAISARDCQGKTAEDYASKRKPKLKALFVQKAANPTAPLVSMDDINNIAPPTAADAANANANANPNPNTATTNSVTAATATAGSAAAAAAASVTTTDTNPSPLKRHKTDATVSTATGTAADSAVTAPSTPARAGSAPAGSGVDMKTPISGTAAARASAMTDDTGSGGSGGERRRATRSTTSTIPRAVPKSKLSAAGAVAGTVSAAKRAVLATTPTIPSGAGVVAAVTTTTTITDSATGSNESKLSAAADRAELKALTSKFQSLNRNDHISAWVKCIVSAGHSVADPTPIIKRFTAESVGVHSVGDLCDLTHDRVEEIGLSAVWRRRVLHFIALRNNTTPSPVPAPVHAPIAIAAR